MDRRVSQNLEAPHIEEDGEVICFLHRNLYTTTNHGKSGPESGPERGES